jgi:hypothetical protein
MQGSAEMDGVPGVPFTGETVNSSLRAEIQGNAETNKSARMILIVDE